MTEVETDRLVSEYLVRLDVALSGLPPDRRSQLLTEIADHISTARDSLVNPTETDILNLLERLGSPDAIAAEAGDDQMPQAFQPPRGGIHEWLAIALLLFGGFILGVGWFVGIILLWTSRVWRLRDKILGTLVFPGGLAAVLILNGELLTTRHAFSCRGGPHTATNCVTTTSRWLPESWGVLLLAVMIVLPVIVAVHLYRASRNPRAPDPNNT